MNNKLIAPIIGIAITVILVATLLVPIVSEAEDSIGPRVEYTNNAAGYLLDYTASAELTATSTGTAGQQTIVCNGQNIEYGTTYNTALILTDSFVIEVPTTSTNFSLIVRSASGNNFRSAATAEVNTISCADGVATMTIGGTTTTIDYDWMLSVSPNGRYANIPGHLANVYFSDPSELMAYNYNATTGYTTYHDGKATSSTYGEGTSTLNTSKVDGTTDVFRCDNVGLTVHFNGGASTPSIGAGVALHKVIGHETSGYSGLLHVIPLLVLVSLIVGAVAVIRTRD